jgi:hypothetical protein
MDYYESAEDLIISRDRAIQEIKDHDALTEIDDFYSIYEVKDSYEAQDVLTWLGY